MFIQPIVTVAIYYFVFGVGFRSGDPIEGSLRAVAGSRHCAVVLLQRGVKYRNKLSPGYSYLVKGGIPCRDPADH